MSLNEFKTLARIPIMVLAQAEGHGLDRSALMRRAGLTEAELSDPDARVAYSKMRALWQAVDDACKDPAEGIQIGRGARSHDLGLVGYAMRHSANLGAAYTRLSQYCRVVTDALECDVEPTASGARLMVRVHPSMSALDLSIIIRMAYFVAIGRNMTGTHFTPRSVGLSVSRPDSAAEFHDFFGCPVEFDHPYSWLDLDREQLALPIQSADQSLSHYLDTLAARQLDQLTGGDSFDSRVRKALWSLLMSDGGKPTLARTAEELALSSRSLQRRLREAGVSFSSLLAELRRDMSISLLNDPRMSVADIAFTLGYSEPSAFHRAFRGWYRTSPERYRQRQAAPAG